MCYFTYGMWDRYVFQPLISLEQEESSGVYVYIRIYRSAVCTVNVDRFLHEQKKYVERTSANLLYKCFDSYHT